MTYMKYRVIRLFSFLLGISVLFACADEDLIKKGSEVVEGRATTIRLSFKPEEPEKIETKAALLENRVQNLYVFIFDAQSGEKITGQYFPSLGNEENGAVMLETTSGLRHIYGVANLSTDAFEYSVDELDKIQNETQLLQKEMTLKQNSIRNLGGYYFMTGFYTDNEKAETAPACNIKEDGTIEIQSLESTTSGTQAIKLKKLHSKITFNIGLSEDNNRLATAFTLHSYSIINIPKKSALYESSPLASTNYFEVKDEKTFSQGGNGFVFYMLENKQTAKNEITDYENREDKNPNGTWVNAPDQSTYVVLHGNYKGKAIKYDNQKKPITNENGENVLYDVDADVTYYIHLGYVKNIASDFSSLRNIDYTYKVGIYGVDKLVIEVETNDKYDRGDGDIYYMDGGNIIETDAHYASYVLSFSRGQLGKEGLQFKLMVNSNKTNGFEEKDLGWISFVRNVKSDPEKLVCYPGTGHKLLLGASDFVEDLKRFKEAGKDPDERIYYTCFIQEYYDTDDNWKEYVNQSDRVVQVLCNSHSGNGSSTIDAAYIIRQKSIQTFYNVSNNLVHSAWGLEWKNETTEKRVIPSKVGGADQVVEIGLEYGSPSTIGTSWSNGRWNMMWEIGTNAAWYVGNVSPKTSAEPVVQKYQNYLEKAYAACMQRNRDENGDGVITGDEIKWYLPAIYQYTDIAVGANVLPERAQLYSTEDYNTKFYEGGKYYWLFKHFVSNTSKKIYWAEEGGPYSNFDGDKGYISSSVQSNARQLRCIRNLGKDSSKSSIIETEMPDDFVEYTNNVVDLTKTNSYALRANDKKTSGELGQHNERDLLSRAYTKFRIAKNWATAKSYGYSFVGIGGGDYVLSDNNGWYYIMGSSDQVQLKQSNYKGTFIDVDKNAGTYSWRNGGGAKWEGAGKGSLALSDLNGYYLVNAKNGTWKNTTPNTYVYVGNNKGIYKQYVNAENQTFSWTGQNIMADMQSKSICSEYTEEAGGKDLGTWRLPNLRELLLIDSRAQLRSNKLISRTYYSFYLNDLYAAGASIPNNDGSIPNGGNTIFSPMNKLARQGFGFNKSFVFLLNPGSNSGYYVRCVKDVD